MMNEKWEILAPGCAVFYWPLEESGKRLDIIRKAGAYYQPVCSNVSGEDRASLIVAAPELLEACITAREMLDEETSWQEAARAQLDAAIAKARG